MSNILFSSFQLGPITLKNRVVMAPMTRNRSDAQGVPTEIVATYYAQRATAGLIITEGIAPTANGLGYARIPGLFNDAQVKAWKGVTGEVHKAGGKIFAQLMHTGRASHPSNMLPGAKVVAPSAVGMKGDIYTDALGMQKFPVPHALLEQEIEVELEGFAHAAHQAIQAGFDGVELHGANGYLIDQFLNTASNQRKDAWGGSVENRIRFAVEAAKRAAARIGADKLGLRVSPYGAFNETQPDAEMDALYAALAKEVSKLDLAYIHVVDHSSMGAPVVSSQVKHGIRSNFKNAYILSGGYDAAKAEADLQEKKGELVAFGRPFISNPNLVAKLKSGAALAAPDFATFYTPGPKGYSDYPLDG